MAATSQDPRRLGVDAPASTHDVRARLAFWLTAAAFALLVLAKFDAGTGFASLIRFGETWESRRLPELREMSLPVVPRSAGYDGQFYAQLALDPLLRDPRLAEALDAPAYRARRILLPVTAAVVGQGNAWWTMQAYALLNVVCWAGFAWLLRREFPDAGWVSFARWFGVVFSMGVLESVRQSLVDLPALMLLLLAVRTHAQPAIGRSGVFLALGHLAKETNALGSVALVCGRPWTFRAVAMLATSLLPLAGWVYYVMQRFADVPTASAGFGNFTWPLLGAWQQWVLSAGKLTTGNLDGRYSFAVLCILGFAVQLGVLLGRREPGRAWWRIGAAYALLLLFLGPWVWSGYWAVCRAVLPLTMAFNLLVPSGRWFWPLWALGNVTVLHGVWRFL